MTEARFLLKLFKKKKNCDFWSVVTRLRFSCIGAEAFRTWKIGSGKKVAEKKSRRSQKSHEMY